MSMNQLRAVLPARAKKYIWNIKYGLIGYSEMTAPEDAVEFLSGRLAENGALLELGCGKGSLLRGLRKIGWTGFYCGVDISKNAIRYARNIEDQRSSWVVSDLESFRSPFKWDYIAMIESIYYLNLDRVPSLLRGVVEMLSDNGTLLIRMHDLTKHKRYVAVIQELYPDAQKLSDNLFGVAKAAGMNGR